MAFCGNCGNEHEEDLNFCEKCGNRIKNQNNNAYMDTNIHRKDTDYNPYHVKSTLDIYKYSMIENFANFSGRASKKEYWTTFFINMIAIFILYGGSEISFTFALLSILYGAAVIVPGLALTIRRLHDTNKSGAWVLIGFIPIIGLILLIFLITEGTNGINQYGPENPL